MSADFLKELYSLEGQVAIVTGGNGVLGGAMARGLARAGARVGVLGRRQNLVEQVVGEIEQAGGQALAVPASVLETEALEQVRDTVLERWGRIDILVNAAGGNTPGSVVMPDQSVFNLPEKVFREVFDLNLLGTVLPTQVFGAAMVNRADGGAPSGSIINISSLSVPRALTRVVGYSAAKAGIDNYTRWMAVELAQKHGAGVRVNAIAPGFFLGEQNRPFLVNADGSLSPRGQQIVSHTPAGRFGEPEELVSTLVWLCGPGARFVTGTVVAVDGGFGAFSGV